MTPLPDTITLTTADPRYPESLRACLGSGAGERLVAVGRLAALGSHKLAFFCSIRCPGSVILQTYDAVCALRDAGVTAISGFHSPMERECLTLLLRGTQPIVVCPARSIEGMRVPTEWRAPLAEGRMLLLSPFGPKDRRATAALARRRNEFVAALADDLFIAHAEKGGATEQLARRALRWGKRVLTLDSPDNAALVASGAQAVKPESIHEFLATRHREEG